MQGFFAPVYDPKESMQSSQREKQSTVDEEVSESQSKLTHWNSSYRKPCVTSLIRPMS